jgi:hypothetical protein
MTELNPNHPVTEELHEQWHKIVAILMLKMGVRELELHPEDVIRAVDQFSGTMPVLVADARNNRFVLRLMSYDEALALMRSEGGLRN